MNQTSYINQIDHVLKSYTILPTDVCNIILHYANTTIKRIDYDYYKYNNITYYIKKDTVYYNDVYIKGYTRSFGITTINGTDCLIVEYDNIFTIRNLANNRILTTYKYDSFFIGVWYHKNRIYLSINTNKLDDDAFAVVILEIDCMFNIVVADCNICGTIEYIDDHMLIAKHNYMLHIYTINLIPVCAINIGQLIYIGWIVKRDDVLYYCTTGNIKYRIDIENKRIVM